MAEIFLQHSVELAYAKIGQKSKQVIQNLKETVDSDQMLALGVLFTEMQPANVELTGVITVKRTIHQTGEEGVS